MLEAVALKYAEQLRAWRLDEPSRLAFQRRRDEVRLQAEREHWEAQKRAEQEEKQRAAMSEHAKKVFVPGWEAGLKKAGFPKPTQQLYEEVMVRCNQRAQSGALVTTDDIAEFTYRACKLLELPPKGQKPKPAPAAAPRESAPRKRGADPWANKTRAEKLRSPDYFLRNLRPKDYR